MPVDFKERFTNLEYTKINCLKFCGCFLVGLAFAHYDSTYKSNRKLCLSILKQFGLGRRVMETRILMEVEEMVKKVREKQGRPFDMRQLTTSCIANLMMSMLFGHRFDHSDPAFQQYISDIHDGNANYSMALDMFPVLRFLPHFKSLIAKGSKSYKSAISFVKKNIAACSQVCNSTSWYKHLEDYSA